MIDFFCLLKVFRLECVWLSVLFSLGCVLSGFSVACHFACVLAELVAAFVGLLILFVADLFRTADPDFLSSTFSSSWACFAALRVVGILQIFKPYDVVVSMKHTSAGKEAIGK